MRPRFLIHVGPHKTGTTYLQACFTASRDVLAERGISYPRQWQWREQGGHLYLPGLIAKGDASLAAEFANLHSNGCNLVLLSAEGLSSLNPAQIARLRGLTGEAEVDIVLYIRRFSELLPSAWQEEVRHGGRTTFPAFAYSHIALPGASTVLNLEQRIARFVSVFGAEHVKLVSYNNLLDQGNDIFSHFSSEFLGSRFDPVPMQGRQNASMGPIDAEMIRALNGVHHLQGGKPGPALRHGYSQAVRRHEPENLQSLRDAMEQDLATLKLGDQIPALHGSHVKIQRSFGNLMVNPTPDGACFAARESKIAYVDANYLAQPGSFDVLRQLYCSALAYGSTHASP